MNFNFIYKANLAEAQAAMTRLLPHLPWPRLMEQMNSCGVALPKIGDDSNLPVLEHPEAIISNVGPYIFRYLPELWKPAYYANKQRMRRNAQLVRLHAACTISTGNVPIGLDDDTDGVVAGVILLAIQPMPSPLRTKLFSLAHKNWWGMFFAAHGMVLENEAMPLLGGISNDPRLAAALWRENPDLAEPIIAMAMRRNDLWSASIALQQPLADQWLGRVCVFASKNSLAALTAIVLQPSAPVELRNIWLSRLCTSHPRLAYLAARWARFTWPVGWEDLRDSLRKRSTSDRGQIWFHFYRDVMPECIDEAVRENEVAVLWQAELIHHSRNQGQELRRRMTQRLRDDADKKEARMTLKWLGRRGRLHD